MKNRVKRLTAIAGAVVLAIGIFTGCGNSAATNSSAGNSSTEKAGAETSGELETIEFAIPGSDNAFSGEIVNLAIKKGYIEEELNAVGYTAHWNAFLSGTEINEAVAGGSVVGGQLGDMPAFVSNSNGVETTIIAETNNNLQYVILAGNGVEINSPKDFEGKKVIVNQGTVMWRFWKIFADANNLDVSKIEIINSNDATSLLSTGEVDAYVSPLAVGKYFENLGLGKIVVSGADYPGSNSTTVFELENKFLAEHEEVAVAIDKALIRAYRDGAANPDEFYEALASENQPAEVIKSGYEGNENLSQANPEITDEIIAAYEGYNTFLVENQMIGKSVDIKKLVNTTYYEKALAELGE